ncbi:MAG: hypothetical protein H9W80_11065 [Enterococcus sp.]|nr:hypothetical protein [Enterococcus sp.]
MEWYIRETPVSKNTWQYPCYEKAKISPSEMDALFIKAKQRLPSSFTKQFDEIYRNKKYHFKCRVKMDKRQEDRQIGNAYDFIVQTLFAGEKDEKTNAIIKAKLPTIPGISKYTPYEKSLENLQIMLDSPSERVKKAGRDIIGQWLILKINGVIEAKDRQLNPSKYAKLDELAELEKIREEEKKKRRNKKSFLKNKKSIKSSIKNILIYKI